VEAAICGNGVGVIGTGTTAICASQQAASAPGGGGSVEVSPPVGVDVCGNGVGVIGTGSEAVCAAASARPGAPESPGVPESPGAPETPRGEGVAERPAAPAPEAPPAGAPTSGAGGGRGGSLPFTGGDPLLMLLIGTGLVTTGAAAVRLRRRRAPVPR
jgi:hypothetical protein